MKCAIIGHGKMGREIERILIERGHSVVVVEHNMEVIKCADWVIDLGPDAGVDGGRVVVAGTPEQVEACEESYTGQYLKIHNERV